jgi:hypothetical protein
MYGPPLDPGKRMPLAWKPNQFKIGINMAGAVSAGAYTAGVLDFLMEALEEWQSAKDAFRAHLAGPAPGAAFPNPVPLHGITIEVFSGASAGGMCAAIASSMVQGDFQHIKTPDAVNTTNTFYEAWVNQIDITKLLTTNDLQGGRPLDSLLDSTIIDDIAQAALKPGPPIPRPYISKSLTLFLTLTNVRGVPYHLFADPGPNVNEFISYYGDRLRFETTGPGAAPSAPLAKPLPVGQPQQGAWPLLQEAAKATGAFPLFLAPRVLPRDLGDYVVPNWIPISDPPPAPPITSDLPAPPPNTIDTLNVDGGATDNDPFELAHEFLASQNPQAVNGNNPREPLKANCAVISVAPFPSEEHYDPNYNFAKARSIFPMLVRLFTVVLSQSRFLGESLAVLRSPNNFSRFVIAPSDQSQQDRNALQSAKLGAFSGFLERSFRAHDFLLGRYNCQMFLKTHFRLPIGNPIIDAGQAEAGTYAPAIANMFLGGPPTTLSGPLSQKIWMPVIPLVGTACSPMPKPARGAISKKTLESIADLIIQRLNAIKGPILDGAPAAWFLKLVVGALCTWPARPMVRGKIMGQLTAALQPDVKS